MMKLVMGELESVPGSWIQSSCKLLDDTCEKARLDGDCGAPWITSWKLLESEPYGFEAVQMYVAESERT